MHAPADYRCPFCQLVRGGETEFSGQADVVYRDADTLAFVAGKWWPNNAGHVIVVPTEHYENLYEVPDDLLARVYSTAKLIAVALKRAYGCPGTSTRQHNEPGGRQDVWHLHVHVFPRFPDDELYARDADAYWAPADQRAEYAEKLRAHVGGVDSPTAGR